MSGPILLYPPIDAGVEIETICFDYGLILQDGGPSITSVSSMTCSVSSGADALAPSRLVGSSTVGASQETGASSSAVYQKIGNMVSGVTYLLQCVAAISDGQYLSLYAHISCSQPR